MYKSDLVMECSMSFKDIPVNGQSIRDYIEGRGECELDDAFEILVRILERAEELADSEVFCEAEMQMRRWMVTGPMPVFCPNNDIRAHLETDTGVGMVFDAIVGEVATCPACEHKFMVEYEHIYHGPSPELISVWNMRKLIKNL